MIPLVLSYHAVSREWPCSLAIDPEQLRQQLRYLLDRGYRAVTFAEIARGETDRKVMAVTFDDGYRSTLERGLPVLSELGVPATVFVPTEYVGMVGPMSWPGIDCWLGTPHEDELKSLSWEQLRRLIDAGWEIASHTLTHPYLTEIDDASLSRELIESRRACERELGVPCLTLAYPYGDYDDRVEAAARDAGYEAAAILEPGTVGSYHWPRIGVYPSDRSWRFALKTSAAARALRSTPGSKFLERFRR
jgi:peptidoglycan/xylan/chitin deacetylase (PgdA/CDA1 family)